MGALAALAVVVVPAGTATAATDVVTNCNSSGPGSLPAAVAGASSGDTVTFALSPSCSTIDLTSSITIGVNLTIAGPGADALTVNGVSGQSVVVVGAVTSTISGLSIDNGDVTGGAGGGIYNTGDLTVQNTTLSNDTASVGGAIYNDVGATLILDDSTLSDNSATTSGFGGGLDNQGTATVESSTLSGNSALSGGGIDSELATLTVVNSTFSANSAGQFGGGLYVYDAYDPTQPIAATITNSTFSGNSAPYGGALSDNQGPVALGATIVANSPSGGNCLFELAPLTDSGYNLSDDTSCGLSGTGDLSATAAGLDPAGLQNNGGLTATIALASGSAAIDHVANPSLCPSVDQRGDGRATPCDVGAFDTDVPASTYTCTVPSLGPVTFPVVVSETPAPPSVITSPGTFRSTPSVDFTLPIPVVNTATGLGATMVSFDAATLTVAQSGGAAFTSTTAQTSADNLPQAIGLTPDTAASFSFTFNPMTWTSGAPGSATFTPGELDVQFSGNAGGFGDSLVCLPNANVPALGTTTVSAPPPTPTLQVPATVEPELTTVTAGNGALWDVTVTNTSVAAAHNVVLSAAAVDGSKALPFDLTSMAKSGSACSNSGALDDHVTCPLGTLAGGAQVTVFTIAQTTGLANGTAVTGSVSLTSTDAPTVAGALDTVTVVVISNTVISAVVPGIQIINTGNAPSNLNPITIKLKTPKKVLRDTLGGGAGLVAAPALSAATPTAVGGRAARRAARLGASSLTTVTPPPVSTLIGGLSPSSDNLLCPNAQCQSSIAEVNGNFASYNDKTHPIQAIVSFFVGIAKTGSTLWMDKGNGTVVKLGACTRLGKAYNTPCYKNLATRGIKGKQSIQTTILFVGKDPRFGLR